MATVWMAVTRDKYQLPYAVADSAEELGRIIGKNMNAIYSAVSHSKTRGAKWCGYVKVEVDDEL